MLQFDPAVPSERIDAWLEALARHPVRLPPERRREWLSRVIAVDPDRVDWHIRRAWCCTATRVGVLVADYEGNEPPFMTTARDVCSEILLRTPPMRPTAAMRRGIETEDMIRRMFLGGRWLQRFGFSADTPIVRVTDEYLVDGTLQPWTESGVVYNGSPDDIVRIGGGLFMVDYKSPTNPEEDAVAEGYALQLDHNRYGFEKQTGTPLIGGLLVQLDWKNWDIVVTANNPHDYKANVDRIQEATSHFWHNHIVNDSLPEAVEAGRYEIDNTEEGQKLKALSYHFLVAKVATDALNTEREAAKGAIANILRDAAGCDRPATITGGPDDALKISVKPTLDEAIIREVAEARGIDLPLRVVETGDLDDNAARDILATHNLPVPLKKIETVDLEKAAAMIRESGWLQPLVSQKLTFNIERKKDAPGKIAADLSRSLVAGAVTPVFNRLLSDIQQRYNFVPDARAASAAGMADADSQETKGGMTGEPGRSRPLTPMKQRA